MKFFILGLPHTITLDPQASPFTSCAFTTKVWNLCRMMYERGHEVIYLGVEGGNPKCTENVAVVSRSFWEEVYGKRNSVDFFTNKEDGEYAPYMQAFENGIREAILQRCKEPYEAIICVPWGGPQRRAVEGLPQFVVESGIGYPVCWAPYRVYESYAWMHHNQGVNQIYSGDAWYHVVIPNAFDPSLFGPIVPISHKQNYFLCICRLFEAKGVGIARDVAQHLGVPLKIAGQGDPTPFLGPGVEYLGPVGSNERRELLRNAKALFSPTRYLEPFGGVAVEAMLSGCPVIATDWGAYPETVIHGYTGYRCRTFEQFIWAAQNINKIDPQVCFEWANRNYSLERIGGMYEEYFQSIINLNQKGWVGLNPGRKNLDWLKTDYSMFSAKS
jgi:Glycosyl transferases group 1